MMQTAPGKQPQSSGFARRFRKADSLQSGFVPNNWTARLHNIRKCDQAKDVSHAFTAIRRVLEKPSVGYTS